MKINDQPQKVDLTCGAAGRLGGLVTRTKYGPEHYRLAGRKGQAVFRSRYTAEDRRRFGAMGGRPKKQIYLGEKDSSKLLGGIGSPPGD